jgi:ribosomal protein S18 acetylase RimI-like enzyme
MSHIEFKEAVLPADLDDLLKFDRQIFGQFPDDLFTAEEWTQCHSYWMFVDGHKAGCSAFEYHSDFDGNQRQGCLYIVSTGILPTYQGQGLGRKQKEWQIEHARKNGFRSLVTNMRESNQRIIHLNEALGFRVREKIPGYYTGPLEAAIVMELSMPIRMG